MIGHTSSNQNEESKRDRRFGIIKSLDFVLADDLSNLGGLEQRKQKLKEVRWFLDYLSIFKPRLVEEKRMQSINIVFASLFFILEQTAGQSPNFDLHLEHSIFATYSQYLRNNGPRS
jgi:hypothetical protein